MTRSLPDRWFWQLYARFYDSLWDTPNLNEVGARISSVLPADATVLEVGAGTGIITRHLLQSGRPVVVCEPNESMSARLIRRLPAVPLMRMSLDELAPVVGAHVVVVNVLHLLDDPVRALRHLREIGGPEKTVIVVTPDPTAGLLDVAAAQRRWGVHPLRILRFILAHVILAPLSMVCGVPARMKLDWYCGLEAETGQPCRVGETYLMMVLPS